MKPNDKSAVNPIAPKVQQELTDWQGNVTADLEVRDCSVTDQDFVNVTKLHIDDCKLKNVNWMSTKFAKFEITDAILERVEASGSNAPDASLLRVAIADCRFTGADFAEGYFEDCTFKNVKFDEAGFRFATFKRVRFENCVLRKTDFSNAKFASVSFDGCELDEANFAGAECKRVDLNDENLVSIKGVLGLKGATISDEQLIQIAPLLAVELGFKLSGQE